VREATISQGPNPEMQEATISQGPNPEMQEVIQRSATIRDFAAHRQLQSDLIEHIWQKFGN